MTLASGRRLGPYQILSALGAGGMGEVYRATDSRLNRTVAIKILSDESAADADRRERFEREAKAISALDHPNICALYDVGEHEGTYFLVMPCLEGETLADRLAQGALPVEQAIKFAVEIATALDAAHRHGIIHRDLKPANIMLTKTGVKLLDFGLAKLKKVEGPLGATTMVKGTGAGTLLGTMPYMSPEQIEGREVDARSDIFSLGAVIYEMVTGQRAFKGDSPASVIGAIMKDEPEPMRARQPMATLAFNRIVVTCLAKDPDDRWHSARDLMRELQWVATSAAEPTSDPERRQRRYTTPAMVIVAGVAAAAMSVWLFGRRVETPSSVRFLIWPSENSVFASAEGTVPTTQLALSPDGQQVAFVAARGGAPPQVWIRSLSGENPRPIDGSDGALHPFWSPDSRSLGFFADNKLKRIDLERSAPQVLADAGNPSGGAWNADGVIVFAPNNNSPLFQVLASGGPAKPLTALDSSRQEVSHRWPMFLPDGRRYLYRTRSPLSAHEGIYIGSLDGTAPSKLLDSRWHAQYADGHLFFLIDRTLMAQEFDASTARLRGQPRAVIDDVAGSSLDNATFAVSTAGPLIAGGATIPTSELAWVDRTGNVIKTLTASGDYTGFSLAPDEQTLAFSRVDPKLNTPDLWSLDLVRGVTSRLTTDPGMETHPLWSQDSTRLAYRVYRGGLGALHTRSSNSREELALKSTAGFDVLPTGWSQDGRSLLYLRRGTEAGTRMDVWVLSLPDGGARPLLETPFKEMHARWSPDDRFVAYASDESGQLEIYVSSFADPTARWPISTAGGIEPTWSRDGRELFYLSLDGKLMSVPMHRQGTILRVGQPALLFDLHIGAESLGPYRMHYQPAADGKRFLINRRLSGSNAAPIRVLLNWKTALAQ